MSEVYNQVFSSVWPLIRTQIIKYVEEQIFLRTAHVHLQDVLDLQSAHVNLNRESNQVRNLIRDQLR
jgi:hypothetical protein